MVTTLYMCSRLIWQTARPLPGALMDLASLPLPWSVVEHRYHALVSPDDAFSLSRQQHPELKATCSLFSNITGLMPSLMAWDWGSWAVGSFVNRTRVVQIGSQHSGARLHMTTQHADGSSVVALLAGGQIAEPARVCQAAMANCHVVQGSPRFARAGGLQASPAARGHCHGYGCGHARHRAELHSRMGLNPARLLHLPSCCLLRIFARGCASSQTCTQQVPLRLWRTQRAVARVWL